MNRNLFLFVLFLVTIENCICQLSSFHDINSLEGVTMENSAFMNDDSRGYIWISSTSGLFKYDGYQFIEYRGETLTSCPNSSEPRPNYFGENIQSRFFENSSGDIWFSSYVGFNKYQRKTNDFLQYQLKDTSGNCIDNNYKIIYQLGDTTLFLKAGVQLYRFNINNGQADVLDSSQGVRFGVDTFDNGQVKYIYSCPWQNAPGIEIFSFSEDGTFNKKEKLFQHYQNVNVEFRNITTIWNAAIWFYTNQGLISFNPDIDSTFHVYSDFEANDKSLRNGIPLDSQHLLVTSSSSGLYLFDLVTQKFHKTSQGSLVPEYELEKSVEGLYKDSDENLWIAYNKSAPINHMFLKGNQFTAPFEQLTEYPDKIHSIVQDKEDNIWISDQYTGIYVFNSNFNLIKHFFNKPIQSNAYETTLSVDEEGNVWGVNNQQVFKSNGINNKIEIVPIGIDNTVDIIHISKDWKLILTSENIYSLKYNNRWEIDIDTLNFTPNPSIRAFSNENSLYITNQAKGLWAVEIDSINQEFHITDTIVTGSLVESVTKHNEVLYIGARNGLWIKKNDKVERYNFESPEFERASVLGTLIQDGGDVIWLATNKGLLSLNLHNTMEIYYRQEDGLPSSIFDEWGSTKLSGGLLCFSSDKGPLVIDPEKINPNPYEPQIIIQDIADANGRSYAMMNANEVPKYTLGYTQNALIINATAAGFYLNDLNIIKYRLIGQDSVWQYKKNGKEIRYLDLAPGEYTLEIQGINANGVKGPPKTIEFEIDSPWYTSWWFILLAIGSFFSITWFSVRDYYKRKLSKQQMIIDRQKALQEERSRIAAELHDDLGANLSTIRFMSSLANKQISEQDVKDKLDQIFITAGDLMENMEDIIWATNPDNDTLGSLFIQIREYASRFLELHQLNYEFDLPHHIPNFIIGGEKRRNILLITKEILNNIVKHAQAKNVFFHGHLENSQLILSVHDDGIGLLHKEDNGKGMGLMNINKRIKNTNGSVIFSNASPTGTIVSMKIPLKKN